VAVGDYRSWRRELLRTGRIVQDGDESVRPEVRQARFHRYLELVERVEGGEGPEVFQSLIDSMQVRHDYGAYQRTLGALDRFPRTQFVEYLVAALPGLIRRQPQWAGDLLCCFVCLRAATGYVWQFNRCLARSSPARRAAIRRFIRAEEADGWLQEHRGVLQAEERR
jgi:hypothetical protein